MGIVSFLLVLTIYGEADGLYRKYNNLPELYVPGTRAMRKY